MRAFSSSAAVFAILASGAVFATWTLPISALRSAPLNLTDIHPSVALALFLAGFATLFLRAAPLAGQTLGLAVCLMGALTLNDCLGGPELDIHVSFSPTVELLPMPFAPASALAFVLLGAALVLARWRKSAALSQTISLLAAALGFLALTGHLFGAEEFFGISGFTGIALLTATSVALLGLAIAFLSAKNGPLKILLSDSDGGMLARWMLPGSILIPLLTGRAAVWGRGSALYDEAFEMAFFATASAVVFLIVIWSVAHWLMRMEMRRGEAEEERDRFFTVSLDLLCVAGTDGRFRRLNPAFERTLGYTQEELLARPFIDFVHPDDRAATLEVVSQLARGEETVGFENRYRCKDGALRWMLWSAAATPDGAVYAAARDITERKRGEAELRQTASELQRSNSELAQFAYLASHDLQEPLRAVAGCIQLLQQRYSGQLDARADELIGHVVDGATRMKALIGDLLAYSKVGRGEPEESPVDLDSALQHALLNLRAAIEESGAKITHDPLPTVPGNATLLAQLFQNLIGNSIKFRGDAAPEIHIAAGHRSGEWAFALSDNGIGIEPEYFERIFGIFQRLHTRRDFPGTGIGLALCKKIVERHGGRIAVQSKPGSGSTFRFTLSDHAQK